MSFTPFHRTKIVATVGPACNSYEQLLALAKAGVNVFRLNFSHGTHDQHKAVIEHIERINRENRQHIGILADLQGPKLRVGKMQEGGLPIAKGDILTFVNHECIGTKEAVYMSYPFFAQDVEAGEKVMVDDGNVVLEVVETNKKDTVKLRVEFGSLLKDKKGVNLPDTQVSQPALTDKDIEDLDFLLTFESINWIALSFVRKPEDVVDLKKRIDAVKHPAKVISKIEKPEAVAVIESIVAVSDGIMVARGDLGVEMPIEKLPLIQKELVAMCVRHAKPVIVATQMLDSMTANPSPTRAEVTDVANAVLDGADAVMLSGETAAGLHPVLVVEMMRKIIGEIERDGNIYNKQLNARPESDTFLSDSLCYSACKLADDLSAKTIVGLTVSGYTAFLVASYRPKCDIAIFSDRKHILNTLNLVWGVRTYMYSNFNESNTEKTIDEVQLLLKNEEMVVNGDIIVNMGALPLKAKHRTNFLRVGVVGE